MRYKTCVSLFTVAVMFTETVYICMACEGTPESQITLKPSMFGNGTSIPVALTMEDAYFKCVDAHDDASGNKWFFHAEVHRADGSMHDVFSKSLNRRVATMRLHGETTFHLNFQYVNK